MEFLRRIFSKRPPIKIPDLVPPPPNLPDDPSWFTMHEGLMYPQWSAIFDRIDMLFPDDEYAAALDQVARRWLTKLAADAGPGLEQAESHHFILLSPFPANGRKWVLQTLEHARHSILQRLGALAWPDVTVKCVVILLEGHPYNLYVSHYFPGHYMGRSAGVMITGGGYPHIAVQAPPNETSGDTPLLRTLCHELTHHALLQLGLPRWLDEALAMSFEDQLSGSEPALADRLGSSLHAIGTRALLQEFAAWWTEERLQGFWSGLLWNSEQDEQFLCYEMSRILFRLLTQANHHAPDRLRSFIGEASWTDAGESAAQTHLGFSLGDAAADFLGDGNWTPDPARWKFPGS